MSRNLETMVYAAADTLQADLRLDGTNVTGTINRTHALGPWTLKMGGEVRSLLVSEPLTAIMAHIRKDLYLLLICTSKGRTIRGVLFDGAMAGVKKCNIPGSMKDAFHKVKSSAVKFLHFDDTSQRWRAVDAFDLD